jgi:hypothetical protein
VGGQQVGALRTAARVAAQMRIVVGGDSPVEQIV